VSNLPPAFITAYQFDQLRDEDLEYGRRLTEAGVPTEMHLYPSVFHGCTNVLGLAITERIVDDMMGAFSEPSNPTGSQHPSTNTARPTPQRDSTSPRDRPAAHGETAATRTSWAVREIAHPAR